MAGNANIGPKIVVEGEKEYKKSIADINQSTRVLKSELKALSAEYDGNANSIDALNKRNDNLSSQHTEQEKKIKKLKEALESANKEYGAGSRQVQDWQIKLNNAQAELSGLDKELRTNEKYLDEAKSSTNGMAKSIDAYGKEVVIAKKETSTFGEVLKANLTGTAIIAGVQALGTAMKDATKAIVNLVTDTASYADNMLTMSTNTGISTDKLQELNYMAELTDTSLETVTSSMAKNIKSMSNAEKGTKDYLDAYKKLNVEFKDGNGNLRDSEEVYWASIDALGKLANETERDATAMQLFGKSAQDLNSLIATGSEGMAGFAEEARNMGAVLSTDTLQALGQTDDTLQRLFKQIEVTKRSIGVELAPAMTQAFEKVADKVSDMDDEFADFAGGALEGVVDGFIWMVDNADLIAAGLKGIGAALITKKAADGITYAVTAYRTLTTATQAATVATIGLNTATKASVIGAIASLVVGAGTALYSYTQSTKDAAKETSKLNEETQKLVDSSKKLKEEITDKTDIYKEETDSIKAEYGAMNDLSNKLYALADNEKKTNDEKKLMVSLVNQLNSVIPNLNLQINAQSGALSLQKQELDKLITAQKEYYLVKAAEENYSEIAKQRVEAEMQVDELYQKRFNKLIEIDRLRSQLLNMGGVEGIEASAFERQKDAIDDVNASLKTAKGELGAYEGSITTLETTLAENDKQWKDNEAYIKKYSSAISQASTDTTKFTEKYTQALETQNKTQEEIFNDRLDLVQDLYEESEKQLDKNIKVENKALEKAQKAKLKVVEDASAEEVKILTEAQTKKLALIDQEYLEKMKVTNEDRYKELKAVQDEIDGINNQSEAEERATKLREEVNKKAELQLQIASAETAEQRLDAQDELKDYEKEIAKDRLAEERSLQLDILDEKKDAINDAYDLEIEALEKAQTAKELKATNEYEAEKLAIQERLTLTLGEIAERQELEAEALTERQGEYKTFLSDQKELALSNAKEIYEADLAEFKINNALKYDEVVASEEEMKKVMREYANKAIYNDVDTVNAGKILGSNSLSEMMKYYAPGNLNSSSSSSTALTYNQVESAMTSAIKKLNLTVELDDKKIGQIIQKTVNEMIR